MSESPTTTNSEPSEPRLQSPAQFDPTAPIVGLVLELRPSLPWGIAESLVREALDFAADAILDEVWARQRRALYPEALAFAHDRHTAPYALRRAAELAAARKPRPGDHHGRIGCRCLDCCERVTV